MIPALRLSLSLVASLLLWLPTVPAALRANEEPAIIAAYYLAALLVSRLGVGLVFRIVTAYAPHDEPAAEAEHADGDDPGDDEDGEADSPLGRRRDDVEPAAADTSEETLLDEALDEVADSNALVS